MTEQTELTELTKGQKIDRGDEFRYDLAQDRERFNKIFEDGAKDIQATLAGRIRELLNLASFPTETSIRLRDIQSSIEELPEERLLQEIIETPLICVEDLEYGETRFLNEDGILYQYETVNLERIHQTVIDLDSLSEVEPLDYLKFARPALKAIEDGVRRAQESWFGPRLDDDEE